MPYSIIFSEPIERVHKIFFFKGEYNDADSFLYTITKLCFSPLQKKLPQDTKFDRNLQRH